MLTPPTDPSSLDLVPQSPGQLIPFELERVEAYVRASRADSTIRGYRTDWADFQRWCGERGAQPLPAAIETVAAYITSVADSGRKVGTIQRRLAAIAAAHTTAGHDSPTSKAGVKLTMAGIRRTLGVAQEGKAALLRDDLAVLISKLPKKLIGIRDRAILLVNFAAALRRSELAALDVADLDFNNEGVVILIRRSKTDQEGEGQKVGIPFGQTALCPVLALTRWLDAASITEGAVFRAISRHGLVKGRIEPRVVAAVVKRQAARAGMDRTKYAGHSLRAGFCTQAAINGVPDRSIMKQTRHKSAAMLQRYIRDASIFRENAAARLGL